MEKLVTDIIAGIEDQSSTIYDVLSLYYYWGYCTTIMQQQEFPSQYKTYSPTPGDDNLKYFMPELAGKIQLLNQDNQPHDSVLGETLISNE